ncbi:MAG: sodium-dependent transporter [Chlamydiota bacterium]|jgi:NSS family neurotransmitter:Na+ symporter
MKKNREHWASSFGFIMAAAGSAIGLGTLWQFPYMTSVNGGGLFVLLFLLFTVLIGIPIFIAELLLGRKAQRGAVGIFENLENNSSQWKGVGWLSVLSALLILSYYCVVAGWGLNYVLLSFNQFYVGKTPEEISNVFQILFKSPGITILWQISFLILTGGVVYKGVRDGIEHWSKILTSSLLVILLILLGYSLTLDGFSKAVHYIFYPDLTKLKPSGVLEALGLAFFTLSLGQGVMLTYGSYMGKNENIPKTTCIVASMNIIVSILAALMIFPIIFTFGSEPVAGFGLVFETLPVLFARLPGALILSTSFFILLVFTALTSSVALLEVIVANFVDLFSWKRKKAVIVACLAIFTIGIPSALTGSNIIFPNWEIMYGKTFFQTVVDIVSQWILPFIGLFVSIFAGWKVNKKLIQEEFLMGTSWKKLFGIWYFFTKWLAPLAIITIIMQRAGFIDLDKLFK